MALTSPSACLISLVGRPRTVVRCRNAMLDARERCLDSDDILALIVGCNIHPYHSVLILEDYKFITQKIFGSYGHQFTPPTGSFRYFSYAGRLRCVFSDTCRLFIEDATGR